METLNYTKLMKKTADSKRIEDGYKLTFKNGDTLSITRYISSGWGVKIEICVNDLPWYSDVLRGSQLDNEHLEKSRFVGMFETIEKVHFKSKDKRIDQKKEDTVHIWNDLVA